MHLSVILSLPAGHAGKFTVDLCGTDQRSTLVDEILQVLISAEWGNIQIVIA